MHTDAQHHYAILGLEPDCSDEAVRAAFRRRAKELHPDSESGNASAFIRLKRAYDVLADPARRARYDRACIPRAQSRQTFADEPRPIRPFRPRRSGHALRYAGAFTLMAAISIGGVEWMISANDGTRTEETAAPVDSLLSPPGHRAAAAEQKQYDGFWDPTAPDQRHVSRPASSAPLSTE